MNQLKKVRRLVPVLLGLAAGVLLAVPVGWGSQEAVGPSVIRITNREVAYQRVNVGKRGVGAGDVEVIRQSLYNRRLTPRSIGHSDLVCTFVDSRSRSCRGTYFLPRGKLVVGGSLRFRQFYELAVLGGTGLYNNARGTLTVTRTATEPTRDIVLFRLVG
ncbi:MAG: hypothetical protein H0V68_09720 [Actinobacteria bacterium]|nr:hypothetical protein [Actinomycetota bacterium]